MEVMVILIVIGALGTVTKGLVQVLEDLEIRGQVEIIQTTALLRSGRILWRVLETWDFLSLKFQWQTVSYRWCAKLSKENNNKQKNKINLLAKQIKKIKQIEIKQKSKKKKNEEKIDE